MSKQNGVISHLEPPLEKSQSLAAGLEMVKNRSCLAGRKLARFLAQARTIDPSWSPNFASAESIIADFITACKVAHAAVTN